AHHPGHLRLRGPHLRHGRPAHPRWSGRSVPWADRLLRRHLHGRSGVVAHRLAAGTGAALEMASAAAAGAATGGPGWLVRPARLAGGAVVAVSTGHAPAPVRGDRHTRPIAGPVRPLDGAGRAALGAAR